MSESQFTSPLGSVDAQISATSKPKGFYGGSRPTGTPFIATAVDPTAMTPASVAGGPCRCNVFGLDPTRPSSADPLNLPPPKPGQDTPAQAAGRLAMEASRRTRNTLGELANLATQLGQSTAPVQGVAADAVDVHFKVRSLSSPQQQVDRVNLLKVRFEQIAEFLRNSDQRFIDDPAMDKYAWCYQGSISNGLIRFCPPFLLPFSGAYANLPSGPEFRLGVIIHEAAHLTHGSVGHVACELPAPGGSEVTTNNPFSSGHDYRSMTAEEAVTNAYSYANFVQHIHHRRDFRLPSFDV